MPEILKTNKKFKKIISELSEVALYLWQKGWAERNAGNVSINVSDIITEEPDKHRKLPFFELDRTYDKLASQYFFVTGTGKRMRDIATKPLKNCLLIKLNNKGNGYWILAPKKSSHYNLKPSSELPSHLGIHEMIAQRGSKEKVIMHTHANELVALTQIKENNSKEKLNQIISGMHPEALLFIPKGVGFVPYTLPGSEEIAQKTLLEFERHDIVIWEKHGVFAIGETISDTFDNIDIVAKSAQIYFTCKSSGFEPVGLSNEQLAEIIELAKKFNAHKK
jgi:rhamnulose-1-phosphate aldolase